MMSIVLESIKELDKQGSSWRADFNGEDYMVHCDHCMKDEDQVKEMYRFRMNDQRFFDGSYAFCNDCVQELKKQMAVFISQ